MSIAKRSVCHVSGVIMATLISGHGIALAQCELHEVARLTAVDGAPSDEFGVSVAASGDVVVVGAQGDDDNGSRSGSAYVFRKIGSSWVPEQKLLPIPPDGAAGDELGYSVSVSGDVAVVGAWADDDNGTNSGSAYVFRWNGSSWVQEQKLLALDGTEEDRFGVSVSVSGDVVVVGAWRDYDIIFDTGSAYVFRWNGSSWVQEQKLVASDGEQHDGFGISVAVLNETVLVGASGVGGAAEFGAVYVFQFDPQLPPGSRWIQEQKLFAQDGEESDYFGRAISLSSGTALIGAYQDNCAAGVACGSAYVARYHSELPLGNRWVVELNQKLLASDGAALDYFGNFNSVSGDLAVVGAAGDDCPEGAECGKAYVYRWSGSSWVEERNLTPANREASQQFGPVAVSGDVAFVGAFNDGTGAAETGAVYVFNLAVVDCNNNGVPDECDLIVTKKLYFSGSIMGTPVIDRIALNGSNRMTIVGSGLTTPSGIALDEANGLIYFVDSNTVKRAGLEDGSNALSLVTAPPGNHFHDVKIDTCGGKMYWTDGGLNPPISIHRANLDGSNPQALSALPGHTPGFAAIDPASGKIYWQENDPTTSVIRRANLDLSNAEALACPTNVNRRDVALDAAAGKIYWTEVERTGFPTDPRRIRRANLSDCSSVESLICPVVPGPGPGPERPSALALDIPAGRFYFSDSGTGNIYSAQIEMPVGQDCTNRTDVQVVASVGAAASLALDSRGDCNGNNVPDSCEQTACPMGDPTCQDCNGNDLLDACDFALCGSTDCQPNGIPDECDVTAVYELWGLDESPDQLFRTNTNDASAIPGPALSVAIGGDVGLEYDPLLDVFYAVDGNQVPLGLLVIDPDTGDTEIRCPAAPNACIEGFDPGLAMDPVCRKLYMVTDEELFFEIEIETGLAVLIGPTGLPNTNANAGLAYDTTRNRLFMVRWNDVILYRIDPTTGAASVVGPHNVTQSGGLNSLAYHPETDCLYSLSETPARLYCLDPDTGMATDIGLTTFHNMEGLAVVSQFNSFDCNVNGVPDECEPDCNMNAIADSCEIACEWAPSFSGPSHLNNNAPTDNGGDELAQITTDGVGNWVAVWDSTDSLGETIGTDWDILVARSTNNGQTWTDPVPLNNNAFTDLSRNDRVPQLTTDRAGNWVAVWNSQDSLGGVLGTDYDIFVARSIDNGANWTDPVPLNNNAALDSGDDWEQQLATDRAGNWVAVWHSTDSLGGPNGTEGDILTARSGNNGLTWSNPQPLNNNAISDMGIDDQPQIATDGAGNWVAVWDSTENIGGTIETDYDILVARSIDYGLNWSSPMALNNNATTDIGADREPDVTTDGAGHWVAVWISNENLGGTIDTDPDILVARSDDNGITWSDPEPLNSNAGTDIGCDEDPRLTTDGSGNWVVVWPGGVTAGCTTANEYDIYASLSTNNGRTWTAQASVNSNAAVDSGFDTHPEVTTDEAGHWIVAWYSNNTLGGTLADRDIHIARISLTNDCNGNGVPDECEPDCDGDGLPDDCEVECGDTVCTPSCGENQCNCASDCGPAPMTEAGLCMDSLDNDCDTFVDCADSDCIPDCDCGCCDLMCVFPENPCNCPGDCPPQAPSEVGLCVDGIDNNCDGVVDCADPDCDCDLPCTCGQVAGCQCQETQCNCPVDCGDPPGTENELAGGCTDGIDNDCDGDTACADPDCEPILNCHCNGVCVFPENPCTCPQDCTPQMDPEGPDPVLCSDGVDNDCDGLVDCDEHPACDLFCPCVCEGDVDFDGDADSCDLLLVANCAKCLNTPLPPSCGSPAQVDCDVNCDGTINLLDFSDEQCLQFLPPGECCDQPLGACTDTILIQSCTQASAEFCTLVDGTYHGDGSQCPPGPGDCNGNGIGDLCEPQQCSANSDCDDAEGCTCDYCLCNVCFHQPREFGDTNCDCFATDVDDILCVLDCFITNGVACPTADIYPPCDGDGICDVDDIIEVLAVFTGTSSCLSCTMSCIPGACCDGLDCRITSAAACVSAGDAYQGDGTACPPLAPSPCP